jgi:hypothetical protein
MPRICAKNAENNLGKADLELLEKLLATYQKGKP